jgi:hypothetical protein
MNLNRRKFMTRGAGALLGITGGGVLLQALGQGGGPGGDLINRNTQTAINQSLAWLAAQQAADGSFGTGNYRGNVAITSIAGLAFMSGGHQPGRGLYGDNVTRALRYIIGCESQNPPGFIGVRGGFQHGPMYGHGFATLFLAEVYGMVNEQPLRNELRGLLGRAVMVIRNSQNREGGWRYNPQPQDADISVTICQIMALRAARNAGIAVPGRVASACTDYVKSCQDQASGGFRYQPNGGPPGFARTAAGVVALYSAGIYEGDAVNKGIDYLSKHLPGGGAGGFMQGEAMHYFYGHYYAVQAMWIRGGAHFRRWYPAIRDELLARRAAEGSWSQPLMCPHFCTGMALIILQVPNNYLPILQR